MKFQQLYSAETAVKGRYRKRKRPIFLSFYRAWSSQSLPVDLMRDDAEIKTLTISYLVTFLKINLVHIRGLAEFLKCLTKTRKLGNANDIVHNSE